MTDRPLYLIGSFGEKRPNLLCHEAVPGYDKHYLGSFYPENPNSATASAEQLMWHMWRAESPDDLVEALDRGESDDPGLFPQTQDYTDAVARFRNYRSTVSAALPPIFGRLAASLDGLALKLFQLFWFPDGSYLCGVRANFRIVDARLVAIPQMNEHYLVYSGTTDQFLAERGWRRYWTRSLKELLVLGAEKSIPDPLLREVPQRCL